MNDIRNAVRAAYAGAEGCLWELLMGEQIHIDGFASSQELARRAGVVPGLVAIDLCCCSGAGLRFLARMHGLASGIGVDMTPEVLALGEERNRRDGVAERIRFVHADATATGLPAASADLVWGEDAWCYVPERAAVVAEAARLLKPGGTLACTDWCWGAQRPYPADAERFLGRPADLNGLTANVNFLASGGRLEQVEAALLELLGLNIRLVHIQVERGIVTLKGSVVSGVDLENARRAVSQIDGVAEVDSQLTVGKFYPYGV